MNPPLANESAAPAPAANGHRDPLFRRLFPLLGVAALLTSCLILSARKQEWADEIFTRIELSDPSLFHLMRALTRLGGAGMPLFSLTAWPWAHLFGFSDLSLRLYSCAGVCGAFLVLTAALRRYFSARAASLGVAFGFFACMIVIDQNAEARGYGLYLLLAALAIAQLLRIAETPRPTGRALAILALTQAGLVLGHVLGLAYAGLMLLALVAADLAERRFRAKVYACCMAGWLALLPWIPAIRASTAVAKPHGWIPVPNLVDLLIGTTQWLFAGIYFPLLRHIPFGVVIGWTFAAFCVCALYAAALYALRTATAAVRLIYFLGIALMLAPAGLFIVSHVATPIWVARYMVPSALGVGMLAAGWADRNRFIAGPLGVILGLAVLFLPSADALLARPDSLNVARVDAITAGRPLVCDWVRDYTVMLRYSSYPAAIEFPLDWDAALQGPAPAPGAYHIMFNYRRDGYMQGHLLDESAVLAQPTFDVLDSTDTNWFQLVIANNPSFTWKVESQIDPNRRVIAVTKRQQ
jgi:hypothetical protein